MALVAEALATAVFAADLGGLLPFRHAVLAVLALGQVPIVIDAALRLARVRDARWFPRLSPVTLYLLSFGLLIGVGTMLLMTPRATLHGIGWTDALFTATSAACVTGLITVDPAVEFTHTGQFILAGLIQAGGLGIMTLAYFVAVIAGQGITLRDRVMLRDLLDQESLGRIGTVLRRIVLLTFAFEAIGAVGIWWTWKDVAGLPSPLWWHVVFHAISAYCNAGFSTLPGGMTHASVIAVPGMQAMVMVLIVLGGLGYGVFEETGRQALNRGRRLLLPAARRPLPRRWTVHWRLVVMTTTLLLVGGTGVLLVCDLLQPAADAAGRGVGGRLWVALFNSVTARTAGFNVSNIGGLAEPAALVMCLLMVVGGSPGGTAGGIKTTTFAISLLEVRRMVRGSRDVELFGRRIGPEVIERCFATIVLSVGWIATTTFLLLVMMPSARFLDLLFEAVSAFATVGLTRGITPELATPAKFLIALTMLVGRLGILSFVLAVAGMARPRDIRFPDARLPLN